MNIWRQKLQELIEREDHEAAEKVNATPVSSPETAPDDPEVIDEAHSMLARNPNFGWTWGQALEGARKIIAHKRGLRPVPLPKASPALVAMAADGCPRCGGKEYWLTTTLRRYCVDCNDGLVPIADVVTIGSLDGAQRKLPATPPTLCQDSRPFWQRPDGTCFICRSRETWVSAHGLTLCATCHPPSTGLNQTINEELERSA